MAENIGRRIPSPFPEPKVITGTIPNEPVMPKKWYQHTEEQRIKNEANAEELYLLSQKILADSDINEEALAKDFWL
ncbi:MAG: hypothetical protein IJX53_00480 [Clostridia bacterium]|nr:hypothetical protein [Clostridia bacterium]